MEQTIFHSKVDESGKRLILENIVLYFDTTGAAFQRIEQHQQLETFEISLPDVRIPDCKILIGGLLDLFYEKQKDRIDKRWIFLKFTFA